MRRYEDEEILEIQRNEIRRLHDVCSSLREYLELPIDSGKNIVIERVWDSDGSCKGAEITDCDGETIFWLEIVNGQLQIRGRRDLSMIRQYKSMKEDGYGIFQIDFQASYADEYVEELFTSYASLKRSGKEPDVDHYKMVYFSHMDMPDGISDEGILERILCEFISRAPEEFRGHPLMTSDVICLKRAGVMSFHYIDEKGLVRLEHFGLPK